MDNQTSSKPSTNLLVGKAITALSVLHRVKVMHANFALFAKKTGYFLGSRTFSGSHLHELFVDKSVYSVDSREIGQEGSMHQQGFCIRVKSTVTGGSEVGLSVTAPC